MPLSARAAFFCDDVRYEHGNKISAIGVYNDLMSFPPGEGPMILPKLAVVFMVKGLMGRAEVQVRFWTTLGNAPIPPVPHTVSRNASTDEHNFVFQIAPAVFPKAGSVSATLEVIEEEQPVEFTCGIRVERAR